MARKRLTSLPEGLLSKLAELEACVRQLDLVRGLGWTLALAAVCVCAGLLADMTLELPLALRIGLLWFALSVTLLSAVWMIWRPWRRHHSVLDLAAVVERAHPELKESLVSCIELYDTTIPENERGSALMRELAAKQTLHNVAPLDFRDAISAGPAHRMFIGGLLAWALLLSPLAALGNYRLLMARFFAPWENLDRVTSFWFDVERGDRVVVRGSDVTLTAQPRGEMTKFPETAQLGWVDEQGESDTRRIDFDATTKQYATTIPHVMHSFRYHLAGAGNRSRDYHIRVVDAPAITELKVEIQPPAYTGQPAKVLDGPVGEISVLERSRLRWKLTFNKPLQAAEWQWQPDAQAAQAPVDQAKTEPKAPVGETDLPASRTIPFKLSADKLSATWEHVPEHGGAFRLIVRDEHGLTNESDATRELTILLDQPPALQVSGGQDALSAQATDSVPIDVAATDDVGVGELELHYEVDATRHGVLKCEAKKLGRSEVKHQFQLELAGLNVRNGEMVSFRVRAADERPVPGPNETWSDSRFIRIDAEAKPPGTEQLAADQAELENSLKQLKSDVAAHREQTDKLQEQAAVVAQNPANQDPEVARQTQQDLEAAADRHEELQAQLEKLAAAFDKHPLFANLTKQAQQLARDEFTEAQKSLDTAEQAEPSERAEPLQAAEEQLTEAEKKLAALERQFDKLAKLERDLLELNRLAASAEQLAQRLNQLDKQQQDPVPANETQQERDSREQLRKAQENQLATEKKELAQEAADLLKRQPELQKAARQNQTEQLAKLTRQAEQLAQPQQDLAEELRAAATQSAEKQDELAERQQALREQAEKLNHDVAELNHPDVKPLDEKQLDKALEELQAGNLGAAAKEEARLAKLLDELEKKLREAPQKPAQPASDAPAEVAKKLAEQQAALAKAAQQEAEAGKAAPDEQQSATEQKLAQQQEQLEKLPAKQAETEKESAESALQDAAQKQQQLAEQLKNPDPDLKDKPAEQEQAVERLLKENAEAQQAAADSLKKLAEQLNQTGDENPAEPTEKDPAQSPESADPGQKPSTEVAQAEAPQKASSKQQPGSDKAKPDQAPNPAADQAEKLAEESRDIQKQLAEAQQAQDLSAELEQQKKLAESLGQLNEQIEQAQKKLKQAAQESGAAGEKLGEKPSGEGEKSDQPESNAAEQAAKAQAAMEEAQKQLEQGNPERSAQAGKQAAEALKQLAQGESSQAGEKPSANAEPGQPQSENGESAGDDGKGTSEQGTAPAKQAAQASDAVNQLQEALSDPSGGKSSKPGQQPKGSSPEGEGEKPGPPTESAEQSGQPAPSPLQSAAKRLQQVAQALRQASADCQCQNPTSGSGIAGSKPGGQGRGTPGATGPAGDGQGQPGQGAPSQVAGGGKSNPAATADREGNLDRLKKRLAGRKWGELPGSLQTEILQAAQKKPNSEYADLIRQYFKEIAKTQPPTTAPAPEK